jgi:hypothetical protein
MAMWGIVAATDMAACAAEPQMHPRAADFQTLLAAPGARDDLAGRQCVLARHHASLLVDRAADHSVDLGDHFVRDKKLDPSAGGHLTASNWKKLAAAVTMGLH